MKKHLAGLGILAVFLASGCTNLSQLERTAPHGNDFYSALSNEYLAFSASEAENYNWYNSEYFAKKGLQAASGEEVYPETPSEWGISGSHLAELDNARNRVFTLTNGPARESHTAEVANAQVLYDCWVEQQNQGWHKPGSLSCKDQFLAKAADIESKMLLASKPETPAMPKDAQMNHGAIFKDIDEKRTIYFGFDKADFNKASHTILKEVSGLLKKLTGYEIKIDGYTDTAGPAEYNDMLSKKRADAVAKALVQNGAEASHITTKGHGENMLAVETADDVINRKNRRVQIDVKGKMEVLPGDMDSENAPAAKPKPMKMQKAPKAKKPMQKHVEKQPSPAKAKKAMVVKTPEMKAPSAMQKIPEAPKLPHASDAKEGSAIPAPVKVQDSTSAAEPTATKAMAAVETKTTPGTAVEAEKPLEEGAQSTADHNE